MTEEVYPADSINDTAILLSVETGIAPQVWIDEGLIGINTAMRHLRNKLKREAAYHGHGLRDGESAVGNDGRQMSG